MAKKKAQPTLREALQEPFAAHEIKWRVGNVARNGKRATLLTYIDARAAMDRLDDVVGPERWRDTYQAGPDGGLICLLELLVTVRRAPRVRLLGADDEDGEPIWEWVGKRDVAENTKVEAVKGGVSDAFKRAAVKWGIGRYLYRIESRYWDIREGWANGKGVDVSAGAKGHIGWVPYPQLPDWALPKTARPSGGGESRKETTSEQQSRRGKHDPEWERGGQRAFMAQLAEIGIPYDILKHWLHQRGKPKPSTKPRKERDQLVKYLTEMADKKPRSPDQPDFVQSMKDEYAAWAESNPAPEEIS